MKLDKKNPAWMILTDVTILKFLLDMDKIYKLIDPITLKVRYIGKTSKSLQFRLHKHIYTASYRKSSHKDKWINSLIREGYRPIIRLIKKVKEKDWPYWEKFYISKYKNLTNHAPGGYGGSGPMSESTKRKIALKLKGRIISEASIQKQKFTWEKRNRGLEASLRAKQRVGKLNPCSIPIKGISLVSGQIVQFDSVIGAVRSLAKEGIKTNSCSIRRCITAKPRKSDGHIVKSAGGYKWETL